LFRKHERLQCCEHHRDASLIVQMA
jgi:hypothetical protein